MSHSKEDSAIQSVRLEGEGRLGDLASADEAARVEIKEDAHASSLFEVYLGVLRWFRGLVFEPARPGPERARSDAVARRLRLSDRYSALG